MPVQTFFVANPTNSNIQTTYTYFTAPTGPSSINNDHDCHESAKQCLPHLEPLLETHDAFLVACYSAHPLVPKLRDLTSNKPVIGIFEASITAAFSGLGAGYNPNPETSSTGKFGIVSTGKVWEELLSNAVKEMIGTTVGEERFAGVETTGLNATELHDADQELVRKKVKEAVGRLVKKGNVKAVLLGCAGMAGMDEWVRDEVEEGVRVVDGVKAGVGALQMLLRSKF